MIFVVFTDLDGTLLDHFTYSHKEADPGIILLRENGSPLVLVSSKTLAEMRLLHEKLALSSPFIFENGGGIFWPGEKETVEYAGFNVAQLKKHIPLLREAMNEKIRLITDMSAEEIEKATGLTPELAGLSKQRAASLPFILEKERDIGHDELRKINNHLNRFDLSITKGGRFLHFKSKHVDKGIAIKKIIAYYKGQCKDELKTVGIGDSESDIPMFKQVDIPVLVRKPEGSFIKTGVPNILITKGIGPSGFAEAIKHIIIGDS